MKNILLTSGIALAAIVLLSSFTGINPKNKGRHIAKTEKARIDTTANANALIEKGDTLMPPRPDIEDREIEGPDAGLGPEEDESPDLFDTPDERSDQFSDKNDQEENRPDFMPLPNDTDQGLSMDDPAERPLPPLPPMPPDQYKMPSFTELYDNQHSAGMIDLTNPNIISFRKKSLGRHRVKIEIILNEPEKSEGPDLRANDKNLKQAQVPGEPDRPPIPDNPDFPGGQK